MDEDQLVDWYEVVQQVANGRTDGHTCPVCNEGQLTASLELYRITVRCSSCGQGFTGNLAQGRDDALYAEAIAMEQAAAARASGESSESNVDPASSSVASTTVVECDDSTESDPPDPTTTTPQGEGESAPWAWKLAPKGGEDLDALAVWMDVVESVHNGRRVGLNCPYCSEPLHDITVQPPHVRVRCAVCGEAFEGRLG
jgi:transcription elongation factor Elf1